MKITCNREKMWHAFQTVSSVAPSRSPKPILQNVKLEVESGSAILMATDLEVGIRYSVDGIEVESPGSAVLPVSRFGSILRESRDEKFRMESDNQGTIIRGERNSSNFQQKILELFLRLQPLRKQNFTRCQRDCSGNLFDGQSWPRTMKAVAMP